MPQYCFINPSTNEQKLVFFHMNENKVFIDDNGVTWNRVWLSPNAAIDTTCDIYSAKDFVKATNKTGCTVGDMLDRSAELHEKRKDKDGKDPLREQFYKDYSVQHRGKKHHLQAREDSAEALKSAGIEVDYGDS